MYWQLTLACGHTCINIYNNIITIWPQTKYKIIQNIVFIQVCRHSVCVGVWVCVCMHTCTYAYAYEYYTMGNSQHQIIKQLRRCTAVNNDSHEYDCGDFPKLN